MESVPEREHWLVLTPEKNADASAASGRLPSSRPPPSGEPPISADRAQPVRSRSPSQAPSQPYPQTFSARMAAVGLARSSMPLPSPRRASPYGGHTPRDGAVGPDSGRPQLSPEKLDAAGHYMHSSVQRTATGRDSAKASVDTRRTVSPPPSSAVGMVLAAAARRSTDSGSRANAAPVLPLTRENLTRLDSYNRAQESERVSKGSPARHGGAASPTGANRTGSDEDGGCASEEEEDYGPRVERAILLYLDSMRGLTLYLDPSPGLLVPSVASERSSVARRQRGGDMSLHVARRQREQLAERAEIEKRIRYVTRDQLRQLYLDIHEELIDCAEELVTTQSKLYSVDDELAHLERDLSHAEEDLEMAKIHLAAADETNESLAAEKNAAYRKLAESKSELALISARNVKLQQRLDERERSAGGDGSSSVASSQPSPALSPVLHAGQALMSSGEAEARRELADAKKESEDLTTSLAQYKMQLDDERQHRRQLEADATAERELREEQLSTAREEVRAQQTELRELRERCGTLELNATALEKSLRTATTAPPVITRATSPPAPSLTVPAGSGPAPGSASARKSGSAAERGDDGTPAVPGELQRVVAQLEKAEQELTVEKTHARRQRQIEAKLLSDLALMSRQLRAKETLDRDVRQQRRADADLSKEQLLETLSRLRGLLNERDASLAALQGASPLKASSGAEVSSHEPLSLTKDYVAVPQTSAAPTDAAAAARKPMHSSIDRAPISPPSAAAAAQRSASSRITRSGSTLGGSARAAAAPTAADRTASPDVQRRRDNIFRALDAARRSRELQSGADGGEVTSADAALDGSFAGTPPSPVLGAVVGAGNGAASGTFSTPSRAANRTASVASGPVAAAATLVSPRSPHSGRASRRDGGQATAAAAAAGRANSPSQSGSIAASVSPIVPPTRAHGAALVLHQPATNEGEREPTTPSPSPPAPAPVPGAAAGPSALQSSPRARRAVNAREGQTAATSEGLSKSFTAFALPGLSSSSAGSPSLAATTHEGRRRSRGGSAARGADDPSAIDASTNLCSCSVSASGDGHPHSLALTDGARPPSVRRSTGSTRRSTGAGVTPAPHTTTAPRGKRPATASGAGARATGSGRLSGGTTPTSTKAAR